MINTHCIFINFTPNEEVIKNLVGVENVNNTTLINIKNPVDITKSTALAHKKNGLILVINLVKSSNNTREYIDRIIDLVFHEKSKFITIVLIVENKVPKRIKKLGFSKLEFSLPCNV